MDLERLHLDPGDTLVVRWEKDGQPPPEAWPSVAESLRAIFGPDLHVIVTIGPIQFEVLTDDALANLGLQRIGRNL